MGISGLLPFLKNASRPVHVREFSGCTAAIDVYCFLHKGAFGCAEQLVQGKPTDAYVKYVMKYVNMLLYHNIKPILVFDGRNLPSKSETEKKRRKNRKENKEKAISLLAQGRHREARDYFQRSVDITPAMARHVIQACIERNVDCIIAPYEADAQLAYLNRTVADFVITEDSDLTLFGCDKIIFKINESGDGTLYEKTRLNEVFGSMAMQFNFDKFRNMCIMSGCDYLASLPGIGLGKSKNFWSKISNPDIKAVLPKIPHYLKLPNLTVTQEYIDKFIQAQNTFLYQVVFDPQTRTERPLVDYSNRVDTSQLYYCGEFSSPATAYQLALGNLDLHSLSRTSSFDPDTYRPPGTSAKYGSVAKHKSMWRKGYVKADSHQAEKFGFYNSTTATPDVSSSNTFTSSLETSLRRKEVTVHTSFARRSQVPNSTSSASPRATAATRGEKRKVVDAKEVEDLLMEEDPDQGGEERVRKKLCPEAESNKLTPVLQRKMLARKEDSSPLIKDKTISRYFGDAPSEVNEDKDDDDDDEVIIPPEQIVKERRSLTEAETAGGWFTEIDESASVQGKFIYRTNEKRRGSTKPADSATSKPDPLHDISNGRRTLLPVGPARPHVLEEFERQRKRNPFAVRKPAAADKKQIGTGKDDIEATPSEIPNKKNDASDADGSRLVIADEEDDTGIATPTNDSGYSSLASSQNDLIPGDLQVTSDDLSGTSQHSSPASRLQQWKRPSPQAKAAGIKSFFLTPDPASRTAPSSTANSNKNGSVGRSVSESGATANRAAAATFKPNKKVLGLSRPKPSNSAKAGAGFKQPTMLNMFKKLDKKANL